MQKHTHASTVPYRFLIYREGFYESLYKVTNNFSDILVMINPMFFIAYNISYQASHLHLACTSKL